jgi:K+ transporter
MTLAMLRDNWWWPWWVSSLIDLAVVAIATAAFLASSRRSVKLIAGMFVLVGLVAAVMAPIVMTEDSDGPTMERIETGQPPPMLP